MNLRKFMASVMLLAITILAMGLYDVVKPASSTELPSAYPLVYVYPESVKVNVSDYFTISVVVYNLTDAKVQDPENPTMWIPLGNLYGFDIQFSWDPTIIKYVNHTVTVPVEDYPNPIPPSPYPGILHKPTLEIYNMVDEAGNIPGAADPRVRAWFSFASIDPAVPFNGNGTLFTMTFQAIKNGVSPLEIVDCTLSDKNGEAIAKHKCNQKFGQWLNPPRNGEAIVGTSPKADFTYWPDMGVINKPVNFTAIIIQNTSNIQLYMWDFGDGTRQNTTEPIVQHTYTDPSYEYTVTLKAVDIDGIESNTASHKITVVQSRDLKATSLTISHYTVKLNTLFNLTAKIENKGTAPFTFYENCTIQIYYNITAIDPQNPVLDPTKWKLIQTQNIMVIAPYPPPSYPSPTSITITLNSTQTFGQYTQDTNYHFLLHIEPKPYENNTTNNIAISEKILYTTKEYASPQIVQVNYGSKVLKTFAKPLIEGENCTFEVTIKNVGTEISNFTISIYLNGTDIETMSIINLPPAQQIQKSTQHKITSRGNYNITILAATEGSAEVSIWQNWLRVIKPPKLNVTVNPQNPTIGQDVVIDASTSIHQEPGASFKSYTWKIYKPGMDQSFKILTGNYTTVSLSLNQTGEWTVELFVQDNYGIKYDDNRPATSAYKCTIKIGVGGGGGFHIEWIILPAVLIVGIIVAILVIRRRRKMAVPAPEEEE
jgi:hypothetical protein